MQITQRLGRFLRRKRKTITILLFLPRKRTSSFFLAVLLRVRAGMLSLYGLYDYVFAYCFVDVRPLNFSACAAGREDNQPSDKARKPHRGVQSRAPFFTYFCRFGWKIEFEHIALAKNNNITYEK